MNTLIALTVFVFPISWSQPTFEKNTNTPGTYTINNPSSVDINIKFCCGVDYPNTSIFVPKRTSAAEIEIRNGVSQKLLPDCYFLGYDPAPKIKK